MAHTTRDTLIKMGCKLNADVNGFELWTKDGVTIILDKEKDMPVFHDFKINDEKLEFIANKILRGRSEHHDIH